MLNIKSEQTWIIKANKKQVIFYVYKSRAQQQLEETDSLVSIDKDYFFAVELLYLNVLNFFYMFLIILNHLNVEKR